MARLARPSSRRTRGPGGPPEALDRMSISIELPASPFGDARSVVRTAYAGRGPVGRAPAPAAADTGPVSALRRVRSGLKSNPG